MGPMSATPRFTREALFVDADTLRVNCGRCGKEMLVKLSDIEDARVIDCDECRRRYVDVDPRD